MRRMTRQFTFAALLAFPLALGCEGPANAPPAEANAPDYAKKSADEMKSLYGTPGPHRKVAGRPGK